MYVLKVLSDIVEYGSEAHALILKNCVAQYAILQGVNFCNGNAGVLHRRARKKMGVKK